MGSVDEFEALKGHVEVAELTLQLLADEALVGGRLSRSEGNPRDNKTIIVGPKERGGRIVTEVVPDTTRKTLRRVVLRPSSPARP
jgi:hypothetical protein